MESKVTKECAAGWHESCLTGQVFGGCGCSCHKGKTPSARSARRPGLPQKLGEKRGRPPKDPHEKFEHVHWTLPPGLRDRVDNARVEKESQSEAAARLLERGLEE